MKDKRQNKSNIYPPDANLDGEPGVTDVLYVDESDVGVCAVLVQRPDGGVQPPARDI